MDKPTDLTDLESRNGNELASDYRRLNNLVGDLIVKEPTKATIMRMPQEHANPKVDRWRVFPK